jgi:hypothetical protein
MGFESRVIQVVEEVLERPRSASFFKGTLFVDCSAEEAAQIETFLLDNTVTCGIMVSPLRNEFAFDFV